MTVGIVVLLARLSLAAESGDFDSFEALVEEVHSLPSGPGPVAPHDAPGIDVEAEIATLRAQLVATPRFRAENQSLISELGVAEAAGDAARVRVLAAALHRRSEAAMSVLRPVRRETEPLAPAVRALFDAIERDDAEAIRALAQAADLDARHGAAGETALCHALGTEGRSVAMVEALLAAGADPAAAMANDFTPLHMLVAYPFGPEPPERTRRLAECLTRAGADPEARICAVGWTPLQRAVMEGSAQEVGALLAVGADPNRPYGEEAQPWFSPGRLPLQLACRDPDKVRSLLEYGADPTRRDARGQSVPDYVERMRREDSAHGAPEGGDDGLKASLALIRDWPVRS